MSATFRAAKPDNSRVSKLSAIIFLCFDPRGEAQQAHAICAVESDVLPLSGLWVITVLSANLPIWQQSESLVQSSFYAFPCSKEAKRHYPENNARRIVKCSDVLPIVALGVNTFTVLSVTFLAPLFEVEPGLGYSAPSQTFTENLLYCSESWPGDPLHSRNHRSESLVHHLSMLSPDLRRRNDFSKV